MVTIFPNNLPFYIKSTILKHFDADLLNTCLQTYLLSMLLPYLHNKFFLYQDTTHFQK